MADMNTWPAAAVNDDLARLWEQEWVAHHMRRAMEAVRASVEPRTMAIFEASVSGRTAGEVALEFSMTEAAVQKVRQRIRERLEAAIAEQVAEEEQLHA